MPDGQIHIQISENGSGYIHTSDIPKMRCRSIIALHRQCLSEKADMVSNNKTDADGNITYIHPCVVSATYIIYVYITHDPMKHDAI